LERTAITGHILCTHRRPASLLVSPDSPFELLVIVAVKGHYIRISACNVDKDPITRPFGRGTNRLRGINFTCPLLRIRQKRDGFVPGRTAGLVVQLPSQHTLITLEAPDGFLDVPLQAFLFLFSSVAVSRNCSMRH